MKIVFFGTPQFAADCLQYLLEHQVEVAAVVTQPDRPKGRSLQMSESPVKLLAKTLPVLQPEKASSSEFLEELIKLKADLFVVVAFGQILSQKLLDIPLLGCINVHASLLPKYRGAAPIQRCLMNGELETGVSIQKMVKQLDAGDVIAAVKTPISEEMTFKELEAKLLEISKCLLLEVIRSYEKGTPKAMMQDEKLATFAPKISSEEGNIQWEWPAKKIHDLIRAFSPKPGAWVLLPNQQRLKILKSKIVPGKGKAGTLLSRDGVIACGEGALQLLEVQPEGKKMMGAIDWLRGHPFFLQHG